jgi:hypothetical protein
MNWELTEHIIVAVTETEETQSTMSVREESEKCKQLCMHCKDNDHFIKNCKLLSAYDLVSSMLSLLRLWRRQQKEKNSKKE